MNTKILKSILDDLAAAMSERHLAELDDEEGKDRPKVKASILIAAKPKAEDCEDDESLDDDKLFPGIEDEEDDDDDDLVKFLRGK